MATRLFSVCLLLLMTASCYEAIVIEKKPVTESATELAAQPFQLLQMVNVKLERLEVKFDSLDDHVSSVEHKLENVEQRLNDKLASFKDNAEARAEEMKVAMSSSEQRVLSLVESVKESIKDDQSSTEDELRNIQIQMSNIEQRQTGQLTSLVSQIEDKIKIHVTPYQNEAGPGCGNSLSSESCIANLREELGHFSDLIVNNITDSLPKVEKDGSPDTTGSNVDPLGKYFISRGHISEYHDIFAMGRADYRLAFRGTAHVGSSLYQAYKDGFGIPAHVYAGCSSTDFSKNCSSHYRNNDVLNNWCDIEEVVFGIVDDQKLKKTITFNGAGTNYMDWFQEKNVKSSTYVDLKTTGKNFFSIEGDKRHGRRFFINQRYNGCPGDYGWVVATEKDTAPCPWEKSNSAIPKLMYAENQGYTHWTGVPKTADAFVIFVKYRNS